MILDVVRRAAQQVFVPLTVGGGISTIDDFRETLRAGADKVSINSSAVKNPKLIAEAADIFGSQCVVVGVDAKRNGTGGYTVYVNGGRIDMHLDLIQWVKEIQRLGAGEICLNSIDADGTKAGFDIEMLNAVCDAVKIPVIASGGAGKKEDFLELFHHKGIDAGLAAGIFHQKLLTIRDLKEYLNANGVEMRL